jgi:hypothetical protein
MTQLAEALVAVLRTDGPDLVGMADVAEALLRSAGEWPLKCRVPRCPEP